MKKIMIVMVFMLGFALGVIATIKLFAIKEIDIASLPYKNEGVLLQEKVVIKQNGISITLPKGTELNLVYRMPEGVGIFSMPLTFSPRAEPKISPLSKRAKYFDGSIKESKNDPTTK